MFSNTSCIKLKHGYGDIVFIYCFYTTNFYTATPETKKGKMFFKMMEGKARKKASKM